MSDLTREEIKAACEVVGWEWDEDPVSGWAAWQRLSSEPEAGDRLWFVQGDYGDDSAIALLEATGGDYEIHRNRSGWRVRWWSEPWPKDFEPTLQAAAVRAVNAWAERKEAP